MEIWKPLQVIYGLPVIVAIGMSTLLLLTILVIYNFKVKKVKTTEIPNAFVLIIAGIVDFIKGLVVDIIGPRHVKLTPFFLFVFLWIGTVNVVVLFGFKEPAATLTVPLTFALTTWFGSQFMAVKFQRWSYFNKFLFRIKVNGKKIPIMINPLEIVGKMIPIISLTFRLWGHVTASSIIYALMWWAFGGFTSGSASFFYPQIGIILICATIMMPFLLSFFTLFAGIIQAGVFVLLSSTYWAQEIHEGEAHNPQIVEKIEKQLALENAKKHENLLKELKKENLI